MHLRVHGIAVVNRVVDICESEVLRTMKLLGVEHIDQLGREHVRLQDRMLSTVVRRYRLPAVVTAFSQGRKDSPGTALAVTIEKARHAVARDEVPDEETKRLFIYSLAQMIRAAMRLEFGDPGFQAVVLQNQAAQVNEYALLSAQADQDRRQMVALVNAVAHPAKQQRLLPGRQRQALAQLHASASSASWSQLADSARRLLAMPQVANESPSRNKVMRLVDHSALARLLRLEILSSDDLVQQYQALRDRQGPQSGSATAIAQGSVSQQRGLAVETAAAQALEALAVRLNRAEGPAAIYRVVTSMRVPASILAGSQRAKGEWDAVLLKRAKTAHAASVWDVCLLIEAKASVDAATTDFPRLLRGLRLLAQADENTVYPFQTKQGISCLRGASLSALPTDEAGLRRTVLYCCDAPAEETPRLLSAASRMQLLSAPASVEFASALTGQQHRADPEALEPVWHQLLKSPRWGAVLNQYQVLFSVRELMVHTDDLLAAALG